MEEGKVKFKFKFKELKEAVADLNESGLLDEDIRVVAVKTEKLVEEFVMAVERLNDEDKTDDLPESVFGFYNTHFASDEGEDSVGTEIQEGPGGHEPKGTEKKREKESKKNKAGHETVEKGDRKEEEGKRKYTRCDAFVDTVSAVGPMTENEIVETADKLYVENSGKGTNENAAKWPSLYAIPVLRKLGLLTEEDGKLSLTKGHDE